MFFSISREHNTRFSHHWHCENFHIDTDAGWHVTECDRYWVIYKGYCDNDLLENRISDIIDSTIPWLTGNFFLLIWDKLHQIWSVKTDLYRGSPIFFVGQQCITNFHPPQHATLVNANNQVKFSKGLEVEWSTFDIEPNNNHSTVTNVTDIYNFLEDKISAFAKINQWPIKIFLSGGVDTLVIFSFLKKLNIDFELVLGEHFDFDEFVLRNADHKSNWSYGQLHHWRDDCVLASGTPGDEFTLRSPSYINWICLAHGHDILELLGKQPDCMHFQYFTKPQSMSIFAEQRETFAQISDLRTTIMNIIVNDFQHHHLGNTLTWTPLRDLKLFDLFWNLSAEDKIAQMLDSKISRTIIEMNVPGLTEILSDQKNSNIRLAHLVKLNKYL